MYRPTRSLTFSTRSGSGGTLKLSSRQGLSPNAFQIWATVSWLMPCFLASPRVDQCVASGGADSNVSTRTASMTSSPTVRAAPGRGASVNPSSRSAAKRCRHLETVTGLTLSSEATSRSVRPSEDASTIRDRSASAWAEECRRDQRWSVSRSASDRVICTVGRPRCAM